VRITSDQFWRSLSVIIAWNDLRLSFFVIELELSYKKITRTFGRHRDHTSAKHAQNPKIKTRGQNLRHFGSSRGLRGSRGSPGARCSARRGARCLASSRPLRGPPPGPRRARRAQRSCSTTSHHGSLSSQWHSHLSYPICSPPLQSLALSLCAWFCHSTRRRRRRRRSPPLIKRSQ